MISECKEGRNKAHFQHHPLYSRLDSFLKGSILQLFNAYNICLRLPTSHVFNHTDQPHFMVIILCFFLKRKHKKGWCVAGCACNQLMPHITG